MNVAVRDTPHFADQIIGRVRELAHPLCVGLDPHLDPIPAAFRRGSMTHADPETADAVQAFCLEVVDRLEKRVAVVKPQIALFERLGWRGLRALETVVARCRERGLLVVLDAKRGDLGSTAEGYADAYLSATAPLSVDALTLHPYLGRDSLQPFLDRCESNGRGIFVLVKTSNPGSGDLQDLVLESGPVFGAVARMLCDGCDALRGPSTGWSSLGAVVGATYPSEAETIREALPNALFLVPGFGAQGASAAESVRSFQPGPAGLEGGIVNSSRAILFPAVHGDRWEAGFEAALGEAIDRLGEAVAG
jgi:orotidine-5'-phosphate decarboxylase